MLTLGWPLLGSFLAPPEGRTLLATADAPDLQGSSPIRLVVLACTRSDTVQSILENLGGIGDNDGFLGHDVPLSIYVDVPRSQANHTPSVVEAVTRFNWRHGQKDVHLHETHVGIVGQWLFLRAASPSDWFVVLEDDLAVSPCFYPWLLRARAAYGERSDIAAFTLQQMTSCHLSCVDGIQTLDRGLPPAIKNPSPCRRLPARMHPPHARALCSQRRLRQTFLRPGPSAAHQRLVGIHATTCIVDRVHSLVRRADCRGEGSDQ